MEENEAKQLIAKYNAGECTEEEKAQLESWYLLHEHSGLQDLEEADRLARMEAVRQRLLNDMRTAEPKPVRTLWRRASAAAAVLLIGGSVYYFFLRPITPSVELAGNQRQDIAPATNKAILKTGHGKTFVLAAQQNGLLTVNIKKESGESLAYSAESSGSPVRFDTLTNPKGGRPITVRLADGSKVWLNAATTFIYPERFAGNKREVELPDGEMIFEVAHNASQPFSVKAGKQWIEDLGTTFNISNYQDEDAAQTTLVEGSLRLSAYNKTLTLIPGQAAVVADGKADLLTDVDIEGVIAWQKGYFYFERADLKEVMAQFARWYDMEVVYEGPMPKKHFRGKLYRNVNASQALKVLSFFNVKYRIEGKKVIIKS